MLGGAQPRKSWSATARKVEDLGYSTLLVDGRFELGLGTGYASGDYRQRGIALDPPGERVSRLG